MKVAGAGRRQSSALILRIAMLKRACARCFIPGTTEGAAMDGGVKRLTTIGCNLCKSKWTNGLFTKFKTLLE